MNIATPTTRMPKPSPITIAWTRLLTLLALCHTRFHQSAGSRFIGCKHCFRLLRKMEPEDDLYQTHRIDTVGICRYYFISLEQNAVPLTEVIT